MVRRYAGAAVGLAAALLAGCGHAPPQIVEVQGVVMLGGSPLPKAQVRFVPEIDQATEYMAVGVTDDQGRFTLTCHGKPGACVGENAVVVTEDEIPERLSATSAREELHAYIAGLQNRPIPPVYRNLADTPLKVNVVAGQKEYPISLSR